MDPLRSYRLFGLIGKPLGHSFSQAYFTEKFKTEGLLDCSYELFPLDTLDSLPGLLAEHPNLEGLNVTIPYKTAVMRYLDACSEDAIEVGAVNTIRIREGRLTGFNTDVYGFRHALVDAFFSEGTPPHLKALVLGTGGGARAVQYVLRQLDVPFLTVSRTPGRGDLVYPELDEQLIGSHRLIVNATPLGMYPAVDQCPDIPYAFLTPNHYLYDLIYNPSKPLFLKKGMQHGSRTSNGLHMLFGQAEKAWSVWNEPIS